MAIRVIKNTDDGLEVELNNGDLKALQEIIDNWGFKDKESALRFAIAVLKVTTPGNLHQVQPNGFQRPLIPADSITINNSS